MQYASSPYDGDNTFRLGTSTLSPSITLTGGTDRPDPSISDERLTPVQFKRATLRRLPYALAKAKSTHTAAQSRSKEDFDRRVRFQISVRPGDIFFREQIAEFHMAYRTK